MILKAKGNITTEYSVIGATVLVTAITGWQLIGQSLQGQMINTRADMAKTMNAAQTVADQKPGQVPGTKLTITLQSGNVITLDNYPNDPEKAVFTAGVNGATGALADNLVDLVKQLKAVNQISDAEANILLDMANKAHRIAKIESILQEAIKNGSSLATLNTEWNFEGQTYTTMELANMIGWGQVNLGDGSFDVNNKTAANTESLQFMHMLDSYRAMATNTDPAVLAMVNDISKNVLVLSEAVEGNIYSFTQNNTPASEFNKANGYAIGGFKGGNKTASDQTHENGGDVCKIGGGKDSGIQCSG